MTVSYKGLIKAAKNLEYRLAEIEFDQKEFRKVERIANLMRIKGWEIQLVTEDYAQCEVEDRNEYRDFMRDWKESKKCITECIKFGF